MYNYTNSNNQWYTDHMVATTIMRWQLSEALLRRSGATRARCVWENWHGGKMCSTNPVWERRGCVKYYVGYTYGNELIELLNTCAHTGSACTCSLQHCSNHTMNENRVQQEITNCVKITRARATSFHPCAICVRKRSKPLLHHYIDSFSRERCLNWGHHLSSKMLSPSRSEAL